MENLTHDQAEVVWEVVKGLFIAMAGLFSLLGGLWSGFRWLKGQIKETAKELITPVIERVVVIERSAEAAHRRIDEIVGRRP